MQPDIANAIKTVEAMTPEHIAELNTLEIENSCIKGIKVASVKACKRIAQVLAVTCGADASKNLKGSARTLFIVIGAVANADCKSRDGLLFAVTGRGNEHTSDGINLSIARNLQRMGVTSHRSFATQYSVCFAAGGLGDLLGVGHKGGKNELPIINFESKFVQAMLKRIASLTQIEILSIVGENCDDAEY